MKNYLIARLSKEKELLMKIINSTFGLILLYCITGSFTWATDSNADVQKKSNGMIINGNLKSTDQLIALVNKPTNAVQLMQNFKFAIQNDLLLRTDFYSVKNLEIFSGGNKIFDREGAGLFCYGGTIGGFSGELENGTIILSGPAKVLGFILNGVNDDGQVIRGQKLSATFGAHWWPLPLKYEVIQSVFGDPQSVGSLYPVLNPKELPQDQPFMNPQFGMTEKTHPFGNSSLHYDFSTKTTIKTITFLMDGDGTAKEFNIIEAQK